MPVCWKKRQKKKVYFLVLLTTNWMIYQKIQIRQSLDWNLNNLQINEQARNKTKSIGVPTTILWRFLLPNGVRLHPRHGDDGGRKKTLLEAMRDMTMWQEWYGGCTTPSTAFALVQLGLNSRWQECKEFWANSWDKGLSRWNGNESSYTVKKVHILIWNFS